MAETTYESLIVDEEARGTCSAPETRPPPRERNKIFLFRLGMTEIILGSVSCILCVATLLIDKETFFTVEDGNGFVYAGQMDFTLTHLSSGLWCGFFLFISGGLGVFANKTPSKRVYVASMVMSIIASVASGFMVLFSGLASAWTSAYHPTAFGIHCTLTVIGLAALVTTITHSAFCCSAVCIGRKVYMPSVIYSGHAAQAQLENGTLVYMPAESQHNQA